MYNNGDANLLHYIFKWEPTKATEKYYPAVGRNGGEKVTEYQGNEDDDRREDGSSSISHRHFCQNKRKNSLLYRLSRGRHRLPTHYILSYFLCKCYSCTSLKPPTSHKCPLEITVTRMPRLSTSWRWERASTTVTPSPLSHQPYLLILCRTTKLASESLCILSPQHPHFIFLWRSGHRISAHRFSLVTKVRLRK